MPWTNGLGTTAVIARVPDADDWAWRLSLADVTIDGPFSSLPGIDRWIAVARGAGMELHLGRAGGGEECVVMDESSAAVQFSGDLPAWCCVLAGPVVDLNLMTRRNVSAGVLDIHELGPGEICHVRSPTAAVLLSGAAEIDGDVLNVFDAVVSADHELVPWSVRATESCRLAVVTVSPISA